MVDLVNPRLGETLLDPACGTGGFLTCAIEHLRQQAKTPADEELLQRTVRGVEKKSLPHLLCVTNMLLHGIDTPTNIRHDNTLARPLRDYGPKDRVDCIITNPPFGGMEEDGIEDNFPSTFRTKETADLFLVLILNLLKPGGRAAIVLPDGTLFGEGVKTRIKEKLLTECNLHTVVRLPNGVFAPYTGIKTNLLFFTKGEPTKQVVPFVCDHGRERQAVDQRFRLRHIGRLTRRQDQPDRQSQPVHCGVDLGAEPASAAAQLLIGLASGAVRFFLAPAAQGWARITVESRISHSTSGSCNTSNTAIQTPFRVQRSNRLQMEFPLPKRSGKSRHGAPVRAIHSTASKNRRLPLLTRLGSPARTGKRDSIRTQSASEIAWRHSMESLPCHERKADHYSKTIANVHTT